MPSNSPSERPSTAPTELPTHDPPKIATSSIAKATPLTSILNGISTSKAEGEKITSNNSGLGSAGKTWQLLAIIFIGISVVTIMCVTMLVVFILKKRSRDDSNTATNAINNVNNVAIHNNSTHSTHSTNIGVDTAAVQLAAVASVSAGASANVGGADGADGNINSVNNVVLPAQPSVQQITIYKSNDGDDEDVLYHGFGGNINTAGVDGGIKGERGLSGNNIEGNEGNEGGVDSGMTNNNINDETLWSTWNENQVVNWLTTQLKVNGMNDETINKFMIEFTQHNITGNILIDFKSNQQMLNQFKNQFQTKSYGIWRVVDISIQELK